MGKSTIVRVCQILMVACFAITANSYAQSLDETFKRELKVVEGLKVYNDQLQKQIKAQEGAGNQILKSIADSKQLGPQVAPLLNKMLVALETFIKGDLPFHRIDRLSSVAQLKELMVSDQASDSDRFRNIMDIYTIETEYGNTYEAYADTLSINGNEIEVDMLRVGRLALYYQTKDGEISGMYDRASGQFVELPSDTNRHIRTAIKVAAKQIAPELMNLPISAPEGA